MSVSRNIYKNDSSFVKKHRQMMFEMYKNTYSAAGQKLWFTSPSNMFQYPCNVITTTNENDDIIAFLMYQRRRYVNKISLGVHNGTSNGKEEAINLRIQTLKNRGWILEASGASSWIMRKKQVPIITSKSLIEKLLEIDHCKERIIMNPDFNREDKKSYQYKHQFIKDGKVEFENEETMFGVGGCIFDDDTCERKCEKTFSA